MNELLLGGTKPITPETGDVIFYIDMATGKETISDKPVTLSGGAVIDNTVLIDGKPTLSLPTAGAGGSRLVFNINPVLDLSGTNWTIEWTTKYDAAVVHWANEIYLTEPTWYRGIMYRVADGGWNGTFMFSDNAAYNASTSRVNIDPATVTGQVVRWAITCRGRRINIFKDGVKQGMRFGTNSNPGPWLDYFDAQQVANFAGLSQLNIGGFAGAAVNTPRHIGNFRISNFVRYNGNYIPEPF